MFVGLGDQDVALVGLDGHKATIFCLVLIFILHQHKCHPVSESMQRCHLGAGGERKVKQLVGVSSEWINSPETCSIHGQLMRQIKVIC